MTLLLETRRLTLSQLAAEDAPALVALYQKPAVMHHIDPGGRPPERTAEFLARQHAQWAELGFGFFSVRERGAPGIVGSAGLLMRAPGRPVELGYALDPPVWGRGYATELCEELLRWGFAQHRPERIIADIAPANEASLRVVRKLGFRYEGDGDRGTHRYSVARADWMKRGQGA